MDGWMDEWMVGWMDEWMDGWIECVCVYVCMCVCVCVAVFIRYAKRTLRVILSYVACPALPYFATLSHKRQDYRKKITEYKIYFDFLYKFCLKQFTF